MSNLNYFMWYIKVDFPKYGYIHTIIFNLQDQVHMLPAIIPLPNPVLLMYKLCVR